MGIYTKLIKENNNINTTPEQINKLSDFLSNNSYLPIDENYDILNESLFNFDFLEKLGIKNSDKIKKEISATSKNITDTVKSEGITEKSKSKILTYYNQFFTKIINLLDLTNINIDLNIFGAEYSIDKIKDALLIFIIGTSISSLITGFLIGFFGFNAGIIISVTIASPIIEELEKQISIRKNCIAEFTIIFNTFEFSSYVTQMTPQAGLANAIKLRLLPVAMHLATTIIQFLTNNKNIQKKLGIDKDEDKQEKITLIGHIIGTIIHCAWNSISVIFNDKIWNAIVK